MTGELQNHMPRVERHQAKLCQERVPRVKCRQFPVERTGQGAGRYVGTRRRCPPPDAKTVQLTRQRLLSRHRA